MAKMLAGKEVVASMAADLRSRVEACKAAGTDPALAIVRLGERPDDLSYERTASKRAEALGIGIKPYVLEEFAPQQALQATIRSINHDATVHGCLLFRPLPSFIDERAMCDLLDVRKDIDGVSMESLAAVFADSPKGFPPCTAAACLRMLDHHGIPIAGKHVVVIGRSLVIGKPVAMMLLARNASVTICHSKTENLPRICKSADIVVCATGRPRAFGPQYFSPGQTVLDVGINFDTQGRLCGDVDFDAVEPIVGAITPVPGGLGSVTTSITMEHTVRAAERVVEARS